MLFPLLEFIEDNKLYEASHVQQARLDLLAPTNMVDYAVEIHKALHKTEENPEAMVKRRKEVLEKMGELQNDAQRAIEILEDVELVDKLKSEDRFTPTYLQDEYQVGPQSLDAYYLHAKFQYECGDYGAARSALANYLALTQSTTSERGFNALWGKFASEILLENWEGALVEMNNVKQAIEERTAPALQQLQQRSWLLHWSLFVFFTHPRGRDMIIDLFFEEKYMQALQTNCPWLLRYLTTAIIVNKRGRAALKDLVWVVQHEAHSYQDPITKFLECLYVHFDFDRAQIELRECEKVLVSDFFLCNIATEFMETARLFIFETYCRIHQKIDLGMLSKELAMERADAEKWIVDLIRGALLDAKISSEDSVVVMGGVNQNVYQQVIDKTKDLMMRSYVLTNNLEKLILEEQPVDYAQPGSPGRQQY